MIVITVARKPLSEGSVAANVLKHGTGGLNIDGCRVGDGSDRTAGGRSGSQQSSVLVDGFHQERHDRPTGGRWPANLILEHLEGCQCVGVKKVKGITGGATSGDNAFGQDVGWNPHENRPTDITRYLDAEGQETVASWECAPGCPVAELDEQSGTLTSNGQRSIYQSKPNQIYGDLSGRVFTPRETNSGGASRFFKQVRGQPK